MIAFETDIHAVAGLLKRYFRELPDPLFTDDLYLSFVQALGKGRGRGRGGEGCVYC
jgi:breakpoint cluster region protein